MHPGLDYDMFGGIAEACQRVGLGFIAYHSAFLNTQVIRRFPEWRFLAENTSADAGFDSNRFSRICVNSPYLDEYFLPICKEVLENYPVSEFLLDTMSGYRPCCCPHCREGFGKTIPEKESDAHWLEYTRWYRACFERFYQRVLDELDACFPHVPIMFNWNWGMRQGDAIPGNTKRLGADLLPTSAGDVSRHLAGAGVPFVYMTGRFQGGLGDWPRVASW